MSLPGLSIALCTYNGARYLDAQLQSLAAQTRLPAELVVGDDGSSDDTLARIAAFAQQAPFPVRVLPAGARLGYRENFLRCAAACSGRYIAFCDQDDVWAPTKLERVLAAFAARPDAVLVVHRGLIVDAGLQPLGDHYPRIARSHVQACNSGEPWLDLPGFTQCFARELLDDFPRERRPLDPFDGVNPLAHDTWIYCLASLAGEIVYLAEDLVRYRRHGGNVTANKADKTDKAEQAAGPAAPVAAEAGAGRPPGESRLAAKFRQRAEDYARQAAMLDNWSAALDALATRCAPRWQPRCLAAAARLRHMAPHWRARAPLYRRELGAAARLGGALRLLQSGGYRSVAAGGMGGKALAKDLRYLPLVGLA